MKAFNWRFAYSFKVHDCLSQGFYSCTKHHDQEASWGGKGVFSFHIHIAVYHQRKSGLELKHVRKQELMQRPWRDVTYWLASPGLLSLLSYRSHIYQPRDGITHNGLGPPPLITSWEKCLTAGSHGGISSTEASFSVITPACVKLTHKTSQHINQKGKKERRKERKKEREKHEDRQKTLNTILQTKFKNTF